MTRNWPSSSPFTSPSGTRPSTPSAAVSSARRTASRRSRPSSFKSAAAIASLSPSTSREKTTSAAKGHRQSPMARAQTNQTAPLNCTYNLTFEKWRRIIFDWPAKEANVLEFNHAHDNTHANCIITSHNKNITKTKTDSKIRSFLA